MDEKGFKKCLFTHLADDKTSTTQATLKALYTLTKNDDSKTLQGLISNLTAAQKILSQVNPWLTSLKTAGEQYIIFITLTFLEHKDFEETRKALVERGQYFEELNSRSSFLIADLAATLVPRNELGCYLGGSSRELATRSIHNILTFSKSLSVYQALLKAKELDRKFHVYVSRGSINNGGEKMVEMLKEENVPCTLIEDVNVGYYMEYVDSVFVGAEGVTMNGGILAAAGTSMVAHYAANCKVPFYVLATCIKFLREDAFNQKDLSKIILNDKNAAPEPIPKPPLDFTHPDLITKFVTDVGIFPPGDIATLYPQLYY